MNHQQPRQRAPRVVDDWHDRLITAAQARHTSAVRNNNRNQNAWKDAVSKLERSRVKIYVPKTGQNAGLVLGIPASINPAIVQTLTKIVLGEEPILLPEHEGRIGHDITDESVVRKRNYRDSVYAILAALWLEYQGPGQNPQPTPAVQKRAGRFTDHDMTYDYRTRKQGAWKAKDDLKRKHLINEERGGFQAMKFYSLTLSGAKACYHLFNEVFHPSKGPYDLVEPRHGTVNKDGSFYPHGVRPPLQQHNQRMDSTPLDGRLFHAPISTSNTPYAHGPSLPRGPSGTSSTVPNRNMRNFNFGGDSDDDGEFLSPLHHQGLGFEDAEEFGVDSNPKSALSVPTGQEALAIKRKRMLKLDPVCEEAIRKYLGWGLGEEEAWSLFEQGAEQQNFKANTMANKQATVNELGLSDSQSLEFALELSKDDQHAMPMSDSQDPDYLEAIRLSMNDHQSAKSHNMHSDLTHNEEDEMLRTAIEMSKQQPSRWKVMDLTDQESKTICLLDNNWSDDDSCISLSSQDSHTSSSHYKTNVSATPMAQSHIVKQKRKILETIQEDSCHDEGSAKKDKVIDLSGAGDEPSSATITSNLSKRKKFNAHSTPSLSSAVVLDLTEDSPPVTKTVGSPQKTSINPSAQTPPLKHTNRLIDRISAKAASIKATSTSSIGQVLDLSQDQEIHQPFEQEVNSSGELSSAPLASKITEKSVSSSTTSSGNVGLASGQRDEIYVQSQPSKTAVLTLLVDQRERKKNNTYREFFKGIQNYVADRAVMGSEEVTLSMGDFMLALVEEDHNSSRNSRADQSKRWVAEVAIERKCIDDIVSRSAESEGPHFRQERNLRNSLLKYPCFLIEGDVNHTDRSAPRVPQGFEDQYLEQRLDIIHNREELLGYMCGIVSRNYGTHKVMLLQTSNPVESSIMLAAISVIVADEFDRLLASSLVPKLPELTRFQKYWNGKVRNGRQDLFAGDLECENISTHMVQRIERRFGESHALDYVYQQLCQTEANRKLLLTDLSLSASNLRDEVIERDQDFIVNDVSSIRSESKKIAELRLSSMSLSSSASQDFWISPDKWEIQHGTVVYHNTAFDKLTDSMKGYADFVSHRIVDSTQSSPEELSELAWCEIVKRRTAVLPGLSTTVRHRSSSTFMTIFQGMNIIEALTDAIDEIGISSVPAHRSNNTEMDAKEQIALSQDRQKELQYVRKAWENLFATFSPELLNRWNAEKNRSRCPQMVILLDNFGRGSGVIGACGRLKNVYADTAQGSQSSSTSSSYLYLAKNRKPISLTAARELTSKLSWITNLFFVVGMFEYGVQPFHCNNSLTSPEIIGTLVNEIHKNAFLPYVL